MNKLNKIKNIWLILFSIFVSLFFKWTVFAQTAPSYHDNFSMYLTWKVADSRWRVDSVYDISAISADRTLEQNIRCLFYPNSSQYDQYTQCRNSVKWWLLWGFFRYVWLWLLVLFLSIIGVKMVVKPDSAKDHVKSLLYVLYWAAIFFGSTWILWSALDVWNLQWTTWLIDRIQWDSNSIWFKVVAFFKTLVFFVAIIMIILHWFKAMSSADKADKAKIAIKGIINVVVALVIVKIVDYLYYIVQVQDFVAQATSLIIEIAKILWFIVWSLLVLMVFYAWFLFISDGWKWDWMKKAVKIITWIVLVSSIIFLLLLIMYQIFAEFA